MAEVYVQYLGKAQDSRQQAQDKERVISPALPEDLRGQDDNDGKKGRHRHGPRYGNPVGLGEEIGDYHGESARDPKVRREVTFIPKEHLELLYVAEMISETQQDRGKYRERGYEE